MTLRRRCADTSAAARKGRAAALGLALVVLEDEQVVGTGTREFGTCHRLIGSRVAPSGDTVGGRLEHVVIRADSLVSAAGTSTTEVVVCETFAFEITATVQDIVDESLALSRIVCVSHDHERIRYSQKTEAYN